MSTQAETMTPAAETMSDADIQALLAKAVRLYAERVAERENALAAFPADTPITATDVAIAVSAMLKAVNLQVFELSMWQTWSGRA
jgi:mannose/cellobiose epimerase-like protein (N-acyl-D-glucosamine 2-epimerase family)